MADGMVNIEIATKLGETLRNIDAMTGAFTKLTAKVDEIGKASKKTSSDVEKMSKDSSSALEKMAKSSQGALGSLLGIGSAAAVAAWGGTGSATWEIWVWGYKVSRDAGK